MEEEARDILRAALSSKGTGAASLVDAIRARIEPLEGSNSRGRRGRPSAPPGVRGVIDACEACFVPLPVTLELEWVLRGAYRLGVEAVADAFDDLPGVGQLHFEQEASVRSALALHRQGMEFADALHHLGSGRCAVLLSFDRALITQAERLRLHPPVQAP